MSFVWSNDVCSIGDFFKDWCRINVVFICVKMKFFVVGSMLMLKNSGGDNMFSCFIEFMIEWNWIYNLFFDVLESYFFEEIGM